MYQAPQKNLITARHLMLLCLMAFASSRCEESSVEPVETDYAYFPLEAGKYIIYDVDSIEMSDFFNTTDTIHYQVMEAVDSPFLDAGNHEAFRIVRSRRNADTSAWQITDVWYANLTDHTAERVEENLRFIKLNFPVLMNKTWKGNSYIDTDSSQTYLDDWDYTYTEVNGVMETPGGLLDSVVTVLQYEDVNAIQVVRYTEKYARNIGLIYKEEQNFETQPGSYPDGYILRMILREYN